MPNKPEPSWEEILDEILDTYYAPIKMPDMNREGLKAQIAELIAEAYKKGYIDCGEDK